jgi:hypothetical protein
MPVPRPSGIQEGLLTIFLAASVNIFFANSCNVDAPTMMLVFVRKTLAISTIGRLASAKNCPATPARYRSKHSGGRPVRVRIRNTRLIFFKIVIRLRSIPMLLSLNHFGVEASARARFVLPRSLDGIT